MGWRLLLLAPLALLSAAAPDTYTSWYSLTAENGQVVGYGYAIYDWSTNGPSTEYQQLWVSKPGQPAMLFTDRVVSRTDSYGRPTEVVERIEQGGNWADYRVAMTPTTAIITRTTKTGQQATTVKLPPRVFAVGLYGPGRCVPTDGFGSEHYELNPGAMAVDYIIYAYPAEQSRVTRITLARRYRDGQLLDIDQLAYNGDCQLDYFVTTRAGQAVTIKLTDRKTAMKGATPPN